MRRPLISVIGPFSLRDFGPVTPGLAEVRMNYSLPKVLIVDDQEGIREALCVLLNDRLPNQVLALGSLGQAFALDEPTRASIQLVFLDDWLGDGPTGFSSLPTFKALFPNAPVIMMGAVLELRQDQVYAAAGAASVLLKPWQIEVVLKTVSDHIK